MKVKEVLEVLDLLFWSNLDVLKMMDIADHLWDDPSWSSHKSSPSGVSQEIGKSCSSLESSITHQVIVSI